MSDTIETGEKWNGKPTILNPEAFAEAVAENIPSDLLPDGSEMEWTVENPALNGDPELLRVKGYRKGMTFKVLRLAESWGLKVADCWQHDRDKEADRICFKLVPQERDLEEEM